MIESESAPIDEELQSLAHLVTRQHAIVLCCAHSVVELVEEVARNLRGLGFDVDVVCGAEARSALLGRNDRRDEPTIYVVCVQGTLKEQVLKPLRQALATHGGPNQHLFVAVLDLGLPLAMVGQIRRFAEALERPAGTGKGGLNERRQWREHIGPNGPERVPTRAYRAVDVLERTGPQRTIEAATTRTGPQAVIGNARPAKVGVTAKYRATTGQLPVVGELGDPSPETSGTRRRRKTHAPKVRVKPVAAPRSRRGTGRTPAQDDAIAAEENDGVAAVVEPGVPEPVRDDLLREAVPDDDEVLREPVPPADIDATMTASWGTEELDTTAVRPRASVPPPPPARTGDTVIAPPPVSPVGVDARTSDSPPTPTRRSETVLYYEAADDAVIVPAAEPTPSTSSPTARGDTVIGQPPTRFRATPVAVPSRTTLVGTIAPTPRTPSDTATARGDTVVAPVRETEIARVDAVDVATSDTTTARGNTIVAPVARDSATVRGDTVVAAMVPRGETASIDAAPRSDTATARGETVVLDAPSRSDTATARGETMVLDASPRSDTATARGETMVLDASPRSDTATARGNTVVPSRDDVPARGGTVVPSRDDVATARGDTVVAPPSRSRTTEVPDATAVTNRAEVRSSRRANDVVASTAAPGTEAQPRRSRAPLAIAGVGIAAALALVWAFGGFDRAGDDASVTALASSAGASDPSRRGAVSPSEPSTPASSSAKTSSGSGEPPSPAGEPTTPEVATAKPSTAAPSTATSDTPEATTTKPATPEPATPETARPETATAKPPETATDAPTTSRPTPSDSATPATSIAGDIDPALAAAVADRRLRTTEGLYVTSLRDEASTWSAARTLCESLEIDGVSGFRLPHRRELQAIDVAGYLRPAPHWSRTVPDDERESAYVLHPSTGQLSVWYKQEDAAVVCVRRR